MLKINFQVPLVVTRRTLYIATLVGAVLFVLLPFLIIGYHEFYRGLVPQPLPRIPLRFDKTEAISLDVKGPRLPARHYNFDPMLNYQWNIHLEVICGDLLRGKIVHLDWGVFDNERSLYEDTFILDCDLRFIHNHNNWFVPYNLRFWVPPITVDITRAVAVELNHYVMPGRVLTDQGEYTIRVEPTPGLIIDNHALYLDFQIHFLGFRYYLRKHFILCAVIGIGTFWAVNLFIAVLTALVVLGFLNDETRPVRYQDDDDVVARDEDEIRDDTRD